MSSFFQKSTSKLPPKIAINPQKTATLAWLIQKKTANCTLNSQQYLTNS